MNEFDLISRYFSSLDCGANDKVLIGDDASVLATLTDHELVVSVDTMVENIHFDKLTRPQDLGYRALATAASDLAAMGAEPLGCLLALTLPVAEDFWLHSFSTGLSEAIRVFKLPLVGGDTTRGTLTISVTVIGQVPMGKALTREGARLGDNICVSGTLGDAGAALLLHQGSLTTPSDFTINDHEHLMRRLFRPESRLALGIALRKVATAAIDISDGLLADARHVAMASGVELLIESASLPLSGALTRVVAKSDAIDLALSGGDDYELLFTMPPELKIPRGTTVIGKVRSGLGVVCDVETSDTGYMHFGDPI